MIDEEKLDANERAWRRWEVRYHALQLFVAEGITHKEYTFLLDMSLSPDYSNIELAEAIIKFKACQK